MFWMYWSKPTFLKFCIQIQKTLFVPEGQFKAREQHHWKSGQYKNMRQLINLSIHASHGVEPKGLDDAMWQ